jgi:hypothetical protein
MTGLCVLRYWRLIVLLWYNFSWFGQYSWHDIWYDQLLSCVFQHLTNTNKTLRLGFGYLTMTHQRDAFD